MPIDLGYDGQCHWIDTLTYLIVTDSVACFIVVLLIISRRTLCDALVMWLDVIQKQINDWQIHNDR